MSAVKLIPASGGGSVSLSPPNSTSGADITITMPTASQGIGKILQVVQTVKTDTFSEGTLASGVYTGDVITCSITPTSSSSKILITGSIVAGSDSSEANIGAILVRDSTITDYRGEASSNRTRMAAAAASPHTTVNVNLKLDYLDSPSTTSQITYRVRICALFGGSSHTAYVNRASDETDASYTPRAASTLTLMEVAA